MFIINLGDSIAAIIKDSKITKINEEHNTNNEEEKASMETKGALIIKIKNAYRIMGEIAVTRSFGDRSYKDFITCDPNIYKFNLKEFYKEGLLLMGSDGYWNVLIINFSIFYKAFNSLCIFIVFKLIIHIEGKFFR